MRTLALMTALMAAGSLSQPLNDKRDIDWVTETQITYLTVWVDPNGPEPTPAAVAAPSDEARVAPVPAKKPEPEPAPAPKPKQAPVEPAPQLVAPQPAADPPTAPKVAVANTFEAACLNGHNALRAQHGAKKLTWDDDLAASAAALANQCNFHHDTTLGPASNYGQNIAMSYGTLGLHSKITEIHEVILKSWYTDEELKFGQLGLYGMHNPLDHDFEAWGHFTQEVWKSTTKVGCAVATCGGDKGYSTVCNYDPPGNYAGEFAQNVSN